MTDVIVVGAGPAGAFAATLLAREGVSVRLFDRASFPRHKLCGDTLNPGALRVLADHVPIAPIVQRGLALDGMLLTGPGRVVVRGCYGSGLTGRSIARSELDLMLVEHAVRAGAVLDDQTLVTGPLRDQKSGRVTGITVKRGAGAPATCHARLVIAADGRESRLARALSLARYPSAPRRWAIGGYFEDVRGLTTVGEMHVRCGHYIGVAPMPDGLANACLVLPNRQATAAFRDPSATLRSALRADSMLAARFELSRMVGSVHVLGPMAVDSRAVGVAGLLTVGDAAGFVDPMTGDGLRFALAGAAMAAGIAAEVLGGRLDPQAAVDRLARARRKLFAAKWRFNRSLRALVASAPAVSAAAIAARIAPQVFETIIRYAGDCDAGEAT